MQAFARLDPDTERPGDSRGLDGSISVVGPYVSSAGVGGDHGTTALAALQGLLDQDERVGQGHFFSITIVA